MNSMTPDIARPWKDKRVVGPHVVRPVHSPVHLHDSVRGIHGKFRYQWECKYCGEKHVHIEGLAHVPKSCEEFDWLDSELEAVK